MYFPGILPVFDEKLYQETPFFCFLLAESEFDPRLLPPYLPLLCSPTENPQIGPPLLPENMHRKAKNMKNKQ